MRKSLLFLAFLLLSLIAATQPINNDCSGALALTVSSGSCSITTFTTTNATSSGETPNPNCGFYSGEDVWFKFKVPATGVFWIEVNDFTDAVNTNPEYQIYEGVCGSLNTYTCNVSCNVNQSSGCGGNPTMINDPSIAGDTLYIRIYPYNGGNTGDFDICVWEPTVTPINDSCAAAAILPVNLGSCSPLVYTNANSINSGETPNPNCGFYKGEDVWFKFKVPASGVFWVEVSDYTDAINTNPEYQIYEGSCGSLTTYTCDSSCNVNQSSGCGGDPIMINDLSLAGDTLYLRVFSYNGGTTGDFNVCIWEPTSTPINDFCSTALPLLVNTGSCNLSTFTNANSINSEEGTGANCGFFKGEDVWFKFKVPASGVFWVHAIDHANAPNTNPEFQLYEGVCGGLSTYTCNTSCNANQSSGCGGNPMMINDPTLAGDTMYLRIFSYNGGTTGEFSVCVWEPTTLPTNDLCADAITLGVNLGNCSSSIYSNENSINSGELPNPQCGFFRGEDVWFKFQMPASGASWVEVSDAAGGASSNPEYQIYTGTCGSLVNYECDSTCSSTANYGCGGESILVHDPDLSGQWLYIRVFSYNGGVTGDFNICVWEPQPTPTNDYCMSAITLDVSAGACLSDTFSNRNAVNSEQTPVPTCGFYRGADVWFKFIMPTTGNVFVETSQASINSKRFILSLYSGNCNSLTQLTCNSISNYPDYHLNNPSLAGDTIYVRVNRYNTAFGDSFAICVKDTTTPAIRVDTGDYHQPNPCITLYGTEWVDLVDTNRRMIASINPNGNYLGRLCYGIRIEDETFGIREREDTAGNPAFVFPRNFYLSPTVQPGSAVGVRLYLHQDEAEWFRDSMSIKGYGVGPSLQDFWQDSLKITQVSGSNLEFLGNFPPSLMNPTVTELNDSVLQVEYSVSSFSQFIPMFVPNYPLNPLPIEFLSFDGEMIEERVILNWTTASEIDNKEFKVLRSNDGIDFLQIGTVKGNGNSNHAINYAYHDDNIQNVEGYYYQLKQTDFSGAITYSDKIFVSLNHNQQITVFPNPAYEYINVIFDKEYSHVDISLRSIDGKVVLKQHLAAVNGKYKLDLLSNNIKQGSYILELRSAEFKESFKVQLARY